MVKVNEDIESEKRKRIRSEYFDTEIIKSDLDYGIITFSKEYRKLLPGFKIDSVYESNIGPIITHISSSSKKNVRIGDPNEGNYLVGGKVSGENPRPSGLRRWFECNNVNLGDIVRITVFDKYKRYGLEKVRE